jgi:hypothetical protein
LIIIDDSAVGVTRTGPCFWIADLLKRPLSRLDIVPVEVIYPVEAIIASKDINLALVNYSGVPVPR